MKRVVITGIGAVTPLAHNATDTWEAMKNGESGISELDQEQQEKIRVKFAAPIKNFDPTEHFDRKMIRTLDISMQYAMVSAREAYADANLDNIEDRYRIGCNMTSGIGGFQTTETEMVTSVSKGYNRMSPLFIPKAIINLIPGNIAIDLKLNGINNSIVTACASSTDAIGHAYNYIQLGMADVMLTGGTEGSVVNVAMAAFNNMKALSKADTIDKASIPYDVDRSGFVMGEGSGSLVIEELEHALARGANIYAEVVGYGATCDASHITAPSEDGKPAMKSVEIALNNANIIGEQVDVVNAHGTSTPLNDKAEGLLFPATLNKDAYITSTKSMTGHLLGGTGAVEAINLALSLKEGIVTPTINTKNIDPDCENLNIVLNESIKADLTYGVSTSLGFGGHNSALVLKKYEG